MSERERMETFERYAAFESGREPFFDRIVDLVAARFEMEVAAITLLGDDKLWFKASHGLEMEHLPRRGSFCDEMLARGKSIVVKDVRLDGELAARLNSAAATFTFYAGAPLLAPNGAILGALCVLETRPRTLTREQVGQLEHYAELVSAHFEVRRDVRLARAERDHLAAVIDAVPDPVVSILRDGSVTEWNASATRVFGWSFEEVRGGALPFVPRDLLGESARMRALVTESGQTVVDYETTHLRRDGTRINVSINASPIFDISGKRIGVSAVMEDVSERDRTRERHRRRAKILELTASDAALDEVLQRLADDIEIVVPRTMATVLARGADMRFRAHHGSGTPVELAARFDRARQNVTNSDLDYSKPTTRFIVDLHRSDPFYESEIASYRYGNRATWIVPVCSAGGAHLGALVIHQRIQREANADEAQVLDECASLAAIAIERCDARLRLERLALHDPLTGLPNRIKFEELLDAAVDDANSNGTRFALGMLDLDRFKFVNDSLGHAIGDKVIVEVADRLRAAMRSSDTVARISGDEFLLIFGDVDDEGLETAARRVMAALDASFRPAGDELFVHASLGIAVFPDDATEATQLVRLADSAMYEVKHRGTGIGFFDKTIEDGTVSQFELEMALNRALRNGEFTLDYQPIVELGDDTVVGAEALLRWQHPQLGRLAPDRFIHAAEATGLIVPIGAWVLAEAARFASRWHAAGGPGKVAVNVSTRQFDDRHFVETVIDAISASGISPAQLSLEITESLIMSSPESAAAKLRELRHIGIESSIDDFGTGYSSMSYLKRLPVSTLKIDRSFVSDLATESAAESDRAIVESIVALGKALSLRIVAEGVETLEQLAILRALHCDYVQGYLFAKPMTADAFLEFTTSPERAATGA